MGRPPKELSTAFPEGYQPTDGDPPAVSLFDQSNPVSVLNLVEPEIAKAIQSIPPKFVMMTEKQLRKEVEPDETLSRLKLTFWDEYNRVQGSGRKMHMAKVFAGVCTKEVFYKVVLRDPRKLAWVATPPMDYLVGLKEIFSRGLDKMSHVMDLPIVYFDKRIDKDGNVIKTRRVDTKIIAQQTDITWRILDRIAGAVPTRSQIAHAIVTKHVIKDSESDDLGSASIDDLNRLEEKLDHIQRELDKTPESDVAEEIIDATVEEDGDGEP